MTLLMVSKKTITTMKKIIFAIAAVAAMFGSCSQDADLEIVDNVAKPEAITSINASSENGTRAVVDGTSIKWQTDDQLGLLGTNASSEAKNTAYTLSSGEGTTKGSFANASSDITAISATMYPYQEGATWDATNSKLTLEIPFLQTGVKGSFDPKSAIMYAIGSSTNQTLNLAVNFLKITIGAGETNVHAVCISSTTTALSGKMEATSSGVTAASEGTLNSVTLTAGKGKCFEAGDYYIAVKAGDIANPSVSYVYYNDDHTATEKTKAGAGTLAFDGKNVRAINVDFSSGTVTARNAVQLWANGPYFATMNIGATSETDYGNYFAWGGTIAYADGDGKHFVEDDYNKDFVPLSGATDTATKLWGSNWRMPSREDFENLIRNCTYSFPALDVVNSVSGKTLTGKEAYLSNSIFLPAAGYCEDHSEGTVLYAGGVSGCYWSSVPAEDNGHNRIAGYFTFMHQEIIMMICSVTEVNSVRAVLAE